MEEQDVVTSTQEVESSATAQQDTQEVQQPAEKPSSQASGENKGDLNVALRQERNRIKELERKLAEATAASQKTLTIDEDGSYDPQELVAISTQNALAQFELRQAEEKELTAAKEKYPELAEDEDLADAVTAYRRDLMARTGEYVSYSNAAEKLVGKLRKTAETAKAQGQEEVLVSEAVQQRAASVTEKPGRGEVEDEAAKLRRIMATDPDPKKRQEARIRLLSGI